MGCTPGRLTTRYSPDGQRATVRQELGEVGEATSFFGLKRKQMFADKEGSE